MDTLIVLPKSNSEEAKCPECGKPEDVKEVCKHCGYIYPEDDSPWPWWKWVLLIAGILLGLWIFSTITYWMIENNDSLVGIIVSQWDFIKGLKIY